MSTGNSSHASKDTFRPDVVNTGKTVRRTGLSRVQLVLLGKGRARTFRVGDTR